MGVGSLPDSPPMPPGNTPEERERAWAAAHPITQGQPVSAQQAYTEQQNQQYPSMNTQAQPQQQQYQQYQPTQQNNQPRGPGGQSLYPNPVAGIPVRGPLAYPQPGQVILGYQVFEPRTGCCQCDNLSPTGWISVILLLIFFWPLFWIPFVMPECYERYQVPVYGTPGVSTQHAGTVGGGYPVAQPMK